ncbi:unnamed protein product [Sphagnum tenellum]
MLEEFTSSTARLPGLLPQPRGRHEPANGLQSHQGTANTLHSAFRSPQDNTVLYFELPTCDTDTPLLINDIVQIDIQMHVGQTGPTTCELHRQNYGHVTKTASAYHYSFYVVDKGTISRNPPTCEYTLQDRIRQLEQFREQEEQANLHYIEVDNKEFTPSVHQAALTMDMLDARDTFPNDPPPHSIGMTYYTALSHSAEIAFSTSEHVHNGNKRILIQEGQEIKFHTPHTAPNSIVQNDCVYISVEAISKDHNDSIHMPYTTEGDNHNRHITTPILVKTNPAYYRQTFLLSRDGLPLTRMAILTSFQGLVIIFTLAGNKINRIDTMFHLKFMGRLRGIIINETYRIEVLSQLGIALSPRDRDQSSPPNTKSEVQKSQEHAR